MAEGGAAVSFTLKQSETNFYQAPPKSFSNAELNNISLGVRMNSFIECIYLYPAGILKTQVFKESSKSSKSSNSSKSRFSKYFTLSKCFISNAISTIFLAGGYGEVDVFSLSSCHSGTTWNESGSVQRKLCAIERIEKIFSSIRANLFRKFTQNKCPPIDSANPVSNNQNVQPTLPSFDIFRSNSFEPNYNGDNISQGIFHGSFRMVKFIDKMTKNIDK